MVTLDSIPNTAASSLTGSPNSFLLPAAHVPTNVPPAFTQSAIEFVADDAMHWSAL
jgi:hypothetical protein